MLKFSTLSEKEEQLIQQARKQVCFEDKWGRWLAAFNFILAIACIGIGCAFLILTYKLVHGPFNPNPNQQQLDAVKQGFALGLLFGFLTGYTFYKGVMILIETINFIRGKRTNHLLIKYHDAILIFMQNQNDDKTNIG